MKLERTYIFIAISSVALVVVLVIQVYWTLQAAQVKEDIFNEKANMILSKTAEELSKDKQACGDLRVGGKSKVQKVDSIMNQYMKIYNIHIDYTFDVKPVPKRQINAGGDNSSIFSAPTNAYTAWFTDSSDAAGLELKLIFPDKRHYIMAEMGGMFITSVVLILLVLVVSWRTVLSLLKEKRISEHTTDFINNMTHEFKTPLTNIALAGKMITKDNNLKQEEKVKHYCSIILEENEKLRLQVEQVLGMTALERGEIHLLKTELDIHLLIHDALKCMNLQVEHTQGDVQLNFDAGNVVVMGDKTHLTNALCNLIDNALKYANAKPELSIHTLNGDKSIIIVITDKGIGISKEYQEKIFDKFFRVPTGDVHNVRGFGLGLAYVKKILELHNGTIALQSEKGNNTTFTLTLPNA